MTTRSTGSPLEYDPSAHFEVQERDVAYRRAGEVSLLARVYEPQGQGPFPMLLDLHGGGWRQFDRLRDGPIDTDLASHGLFVASLDFRLNGEAPHPAAMQDINYGIRWLKAHAAEFNAQPNGMGGIGFSSGGHHILMAGIRPSYPAYASDSSPELAGIDASLTYVIPCGCAYDLIGSLLNPMPGTDEPDRFALYDYFGGIAGIKSESPQHIVDSGEAIVRPAVLLCQAGGDTLPGFTTDEALRFAQSYVASGGNIEVALFPSAPHIFLNPGLVERSEAMVRGLAAIRAFISRQLAYEAAPFVT